MLPISLQSIYSITSAGEETYYMVYNNQSRNVIDYIKKWVIKENNTTTNTENTVTNNTETNTVQ